MLKSKANKAKKVLFGLVLFVVLLSACQSKSSGSKNPHIFTTGSILVSNEDGYILFGNLLETGQLQYATATLYPEKNSWLRLETSRGMDLKVAGEYDYSFAGSLVARLNVTGEALSVVTGNNVWIFAEALPVYALEVKSPESVKWSKMENLFVEFSTNNDLSVNTGTGTLPFQAPVLGKFSASGRAAFFEDATNLALFTNASWPCVVDRAGIGYEAMPDSHTFLAVEASVPLDFSGYFTVPAPSYGEVCASGDHMAFDSGGDLYLFSRSLNYGGLVAEDAQVEFVKGSSTFLRFDTGNDILYDYGGGTLAFYGPIEGWVSAEGSCLGLLDDIGLAVFTPFLPTSVFLADNPKVKFQYDASSYIEYSTDDGVSFQGDFQFTLVGKVRGRAAETGGIITALTGTRAYFFSGAFPGFMARLDIPYTISYSINAATYLYFTTEKDLVISDYGTVSAPCQGWISRAGDCMAVMDGDGALLFFGRGLEGAQIGAEDLELWIYPDPDYLLHAKGWQDEDPFGKAPFYLRVLR